MAHALRRAMGLACGLAIGVSLSSMAGRAFGQPLGTAITYQGELQLDGEPQSGLHDLRFRLFDAASGGAQVGVDVCADDVSVENGRFTVVLDFGAQFSGQMRWLEMDVRPDAGSGCEDGSGYETLGSRQALTPSPHAVYAISAASAQSAGSATTALTAGTATNALSIGGTPAANVARLDANQTFTGQVNLSNPLNTFNGFFEGDGSGLFAIQGGNIVAGTVTDSQFAPQVIQRLPQVVTPGLQALAVNIAGGNDGTSVASSGAHVFLTMPDANVVRVFDATTFAFVGDVATDANPAHVRFADGKIYVACNGVPSLQVFGASPPFVNLGTIPVAGGAEDMEIALGRVYVVGGGELKVFDAAAPFAPIGAPVAVPGEGELDVAVDPLTSRVFALREYSWTVAVHDAAPPFGVIEATGGEVLGEPKSITVDNGLLYVVGGTNYGGVPGAIRVLSTSAPYGQVGPSVSAPLGARSIAVANGVMYVGGDELHARSATPPYDLFNVQPSQHRALAVEGSRVYAADSTLSVFTAGAAGGYTLPVNTGLSVGTTTLAPPSGLSVAGVANFGHDVGITGNTAVAGDLTARSLVITGLYGSVTAPDFIGRGGGLTHLNAANISDGTLDPARMPTNWAAGGDLMGTYPNPQIAPGAVTLDTLSSELQSVMATANPPSYSPLGSEATSGGLGLATSGSYVFIANESGVLRVVNASNPANLVVVGDFPSGGAFCIDVAISGSYAYVVNHGSNSLSVFDIADPNAPVIIGGPITTGLAPMAAKVAGSWLYVANRDSGDISTYDIANPAAPVLASTSPIGSSVVGLDVDGNHLAVASFAGNLSILDLSNPAQPTLVGSTPTSAGSYAVAVRGSRAFVTSGDTAIDSFLQCFDIANPSSPTLLGSVAVDAGPRSLLLSGNRALVGCYGANTLQFVDVSNASSPAIISTLATSGGSPSDLVLASSNLFIANRSGGLDVFGASITGITFPPAVAVNAASFAGNGSGLTNLNAANLTGTLSASLLPANIARTDAANAFGNFTNSFAGSVAVGALSPDTAKLMVNQGAGGTIGAFTVTDGGGYSRFEIGLDGGDRGKGTIQMHSPGQGYNDLRLNPLGGDVIMGLAGNVGVGTGDPSYPLDVVGRFRSRGNGGASGGMFMSDSANPGADASFVGRADGASLFTGFFSVASGWNLVVKDATGNVGIGESNPLFRLDVNNPPLTDIVRIRSSGFSTRLWFQNDSSGGRQWSIGTTGVGAAAGVGRFVVTDHTAVTPRLIIDPDGDLQIGGGNAAALARVDVRQSDGNSAVLGISTSTAAGSTGFGANAGVQGVVSPAAGGALAAGVKGINQSTNSAGMGVAGIHFGSGWGVYGTVASASGLAGKFVGSVDITGSLAKAGGSFKIDHPLDPENKYLYHSFVESPDMMNIYNGNIVTDDNGYATIDLPDYFEALNRDFRYQLTVIDESDDMDVFLWAKVVREVKGNQFTIRSSRGGVKVSWQVTGVRKDAWAEKNRIPNVVDKKDAEKGKYIHPEAFDKPAERGINYNSATIYRGQSEREGAARVEDGEKR